MIVRPFRYLRAESVAQAAGLLAEHGGEARLLAGGQSLMPLINLGLAQVEAVVDITPLSDLAGITRDDGTLRIGALTTYRTAQHDQAVQAGQPLLAEAIRHVGNPRVRNVGTIGGSLAHHDPAAELPLVMQVLDAECLASNGHETRPVPAAEFFVSYFATALREDELLTAVRVPLLPEGWGWGFEELSVRAGDFALVAVAALARCVGGTIAEMRVGLAGVGERPVRARAFEEAAQGVALGRLDEIIATATADINSPADALAGAEYRRHLAGVLVRRAVRAACRRSQGEMG